MVMAPNDPQGSDLQDLQRSARPGPVAAPSVDAKLGESGGYRNGVWSSDSVISRNRSSPKSPLVAPLRFTSSRSNSKHWSHIRRTDLSPIHLWFSKFMLNSSAQPPSFEAVTDEAPVVAATRDAIFRNAGWCSECSDAFGQEQAIGWARRTYGEMYSDIVGRPRSSEQVVAERHAVITLMGTKFDLQAEDDATDLISGKRGVNFASRHQVRSGVDEPVAFGVMLERETETVTVGPVAAKVFEVGGRGPYASVNGRANELADLSDEALARSVCFFSSNEKEAR